MTAPVPGLPPFGKEPDRSNTKPTETRLGEHSGVTVPGGGRSSPADPLVSSSPASPSRNSSFRAPSPRDPPEFQAPPTLPRRTAALILAGIMLGILMGALDNLVVVTALTKIVQELGNASGYPFVVVAYLIASTVATPIFGKLSDIFSRRNFFVLGLVIFIAGSLLAGLSQTLDQLILFRAIQGFGSGAFFPIGLAIIGVLFRPETRARLTGVFSSIFGIATIAGPFLGSFIVDHTTWRWVFYVNLPIGFAGIAIVLASVGPLRPPLPKKFDVPGAGLLAAWVGSLIVALVENADSGWAWSDPRIIVLLATAAVTFVLFVGWELKSKEPVLPLRFFSNRVIAASSSVSFFRGAVLFTITTSIAGVVAYTFHGSPDQVRDVLYFFVVPMIIGSVIGGQSLTRVAYRPLATAGMGLMSAGALMLTFVSVRTPLWTFSNFILPSGGLGLDLIPVGLGVGLTFAVTALSIQYAVPPKDIGAATSLVQFLGNLGGAVILALLTSYQTARFRMLDPLPAWVICPVKPVPPIDPACLSYYSTFSAASATVYSEMFGFVLAIALAAFVSACFITGRLPKSRPHIASTVPPAPPTRGIAQSVELPRE